MLTPDNCVAEPLLGPIRQPPCHPTKAPPIHPPYPHTRPLAPAALVADLEKLNFKDSKDAARLRSEAASIASQVRR